MTYRIFDDNDRVARETISRCLASQDRGEALSPSEHLTMIRLLDLGLVGMDGFRYCPVWVAKENRRIFLASQR